MPLRSCPGSGQGAVPEDALSSAPGSRSVGVARRRPRSRLYPFVALHPLGRHNRAVPEREERIGRNEILFREVNERIEEMQAGQQGAAGYFDFLCECGDRDCIEQLSLTVVEYEEVRSEPTHFFVRPGHEVATIERVVETGDRFLVVRKLEEVAAFVKDHDPRS